MGIDLWQIPVLVGAGIVILVYLVALPTGRPTGEPRTTTPAPSETPTPTPSETPTPASRTTTRSPQKPGERRAAWLRTGVLAVLSLTLLWLLIVTFQSWDASSAAASVATVASLVLEGAALRLTYLSYNESKKLNRAAQRRQEVAAEG